MSLQTRHLARAAEGGWEGLIHVCCGCQIDLLYMGCRCGVWVCAGDNVLVAWETYRLTSQLTDLVVGGLFGCVA